MTLESLAASVDSIAASIGSIAESIGSLSSRMDTFESSIILRIGNLATKDELLVVEGRLGSVETRLNGIIQSIDDLPTRKEFNGLEERLEGRIYDLAVATKQEFTKVYEKFNEIDKKFVGMDKKFVGIDGKFIELDKKFVGIDKKIDALGKNLETQIDDLAITVSSEFKRIHIRLDQMDEHLVELKENDRYLDKRLKKLETVMFTS